MGVIQNLADGLVNIVANLGTSRDKAAHTTYVDQVLSHQDLLTTYRNSWLARAIIDYPAEDATRKWRMWRAKADQITAIERIERKLQVKKRVQDGMTAARLYGGAAIYINTGDGQQEQPLTAGAGKEVKSLVVMTPLILTPEQPSRDIHNEYYGKPEYYALSRQDNAAPVRIHASRLVVFHGIDVPDDAGVTSTVNRGWGDSVLQSTIEAVKQVDSTMANMASLVFEAKVDVLSFEGFAELLQDDGNDELILRRMRMQAAMKGINGALVIDKKDGYDQKSASFAGLPDVVGKFENAVAGAARIPVTRLYGRASVGLSGTGDGDERTYFDRIEHMQATEMQPEMTLLDDLIIWQALKTRPEDIYFEWAPLRQLTEGERSEIFSRTATAARAIAGTNAGELIPLDALSDALVNEITEQGVLPGLDQAIATYGKLSEQFVEPDGDIDPATIADAEPRSLYVSRAVLNAKEILAHYQSQGVGNLIGADDMHVTITFSRQPVDWMKMGDSWASELAVQPGGARVMDAFGENKDTAVLLFSSSDLSWRHKEMVDGGASWDRPDYQPHLSISYDFNGDIGAIEPWRGEIKFGPEIFKEVNENWKSEA